MKSTIFSHSKRKTRKGFSIVEVAIAMGVVTLLLTTFLGVFGPAQKSIQRALSTKDANRMKDALTNEMSILRPTEYATTSNPNSGKYKNSFDKAFWMISNSHDESKAVLIYQYKADPTADSDNDGILDPYSGTDGIQGRDYTVQTAVRVLPDNKAHVTIADELSANSVEGSVFVVRMTQLIKEPSSNLMELNDPGKISYYEGASKNDAANSDAYLQAVIAFRAEFFRLNSNNYGYIENNLDFEKIGNAVTEVNMAVRR